jgi:hypothetical protein
VEVSSVSLLLQLTSLPDGELDIGSAQAVRPQFRLGGVGAGLRGPI